MNVYERLLIALIGLFCVGAIAYQYLGRTPDGAVFAEVVRDNVVVQRIPLDADRVMPVGPLTVEVQGHAIRVRQAECPKQICVHSGWTRYGSRPLICVPNKMVVRVCGEDDRGIDATSY